MEMDNERTAETSDVGDKETYLILRRLGTEKKTLQKNKTASQFAPISPPWAYAHQAVNNELKDLTGLK